MPKWLQWFEVLNTFEKQNVLLFGKPQARQSHAIAELCTCSWYRVDRIDACGMIPLVARITNYTSFLPSDRLITWTAWIDSRILWSWIDVIRDGYH
jgi:hypothetical protein